MSRRKRNNESGPSDWLTTYSDMVTLLLCFFVLLFSFSTIDAEKWRQLLSSFQGNLGLLESGTALPTSPEGSIIDLDLDLDASEDEAPENISEEDDEFLKLYSNISGYLEDHGIQAELELSKAHTEILLRFKEYILFDSGKADIKPEAFDILDGIAKVLMEFENEIQGIRVEGHTDTRPMNTYLYPTNWELSGGRAVGVARYFQDEHKIPGTKLSYAGFGEYYPIDTNDTEEGMSRNRRVDITIVRVGKPEVIDTNEEIKE
ncbi:MAG: OmpA family protein [Clostridiales bacterium]|nr:OmpA family protein [Clostridiales bacterium]